MNLISRGIRSLLICAAIAVLILFVVVTPSIANSSINAVRQLSQQKGSPGDTLQVTVNFSAPDDDLNSIGFSDYIPQGWEVKVDSGFCSPRAFVAKVSGNLVNYVWVGPYAKDTTFNIVYQVSIPKGTQPGNYYFTNGKIKYYAGSSGPFSDSISSEVPLIVVSKSTAIGQSSGEDTSVIIKSTTSQIAETSKPSFNDTITTSTKVVDIQDDEPAKISEDIVVETPVTTLISENGVASGQSLNVGLLVLIFIVAGFLSFSLVYFIRRSSRSGNKN
jgi:hypothetical protein